MKYSESRKAGRPVQLPPTQVHFRPHEILKPAAQHLPIYTFPISIFCVENLKILKHHKTLYTTLVVPITLPVTTGTEYGKYRIWAQLVHAYPRKADFSAHQNDCTREPSWKFLNPKKTYFAIFQIQVIPWEMTHQMTRFFTMSYLGFCNFVNIPRISRFQHNPSAGLEVFLKMGNICT